MPICLNLVVVFALAVMVTMVDARLLDRNAPLAVLLLDGEVTHISNRYASIPTQGYLLHAWCPRLGGRSSHI